MKKILLFALTLLLVLSSCVKREPDNTPPVSTLMKYAKNAAEMEKIKTTYFSSDKNNPVSQSYKKSLQGYDFSKIKEYIILEESPHFAGIFKLYDSVNAAELEEKISGRLADLQQTEKSVKTLKILNSAEVRSFGGYVYYAAGDKRDEIFRAVETALK